MGDKPIEGPCWAQIRLPVEGLFVVAGDGRFVKRSFAHSEEPLIDFAKRPAKKKKKKVLRMLVEKEEKKNPSFEKASWNTTRSVRCIRLGFERPGRTCIEGILI